MAGIEAAHKLLQPGDRTVIELLSRPMSVHASMPPGATIELLKVPITKLFCSNRQAARKILEWFRMMAPIRCSSKALNDMYAAVQVVPFDDTGYAIWLLDRPEECLGKLPDVH